MWSMKEFAGDALTLSEETSPNLLSSCMRFSSVVLLARCPNQRVVLQTENKIPIRYSQLLLCKY